MTPVSPLQVFNREHIASHALLSNFHCSIPASIHFHLLAATVALSKLSAVHDQGRPCAHSTGSLGCIPGFSRALQGPLAETQRLLMVHRAPYSPSMVISLCARPLTFWCSLPFRDRMFNTLSATLLFRQKDIIELLRKFRLILTLSTHQVEAVCLLRLSQRPIDVASGFPLGNFSRTLWSGLPP